MLCEACTDAHELQGDVRELVTLLKGEQGVIARQLDHETRIRKLEGRWWQFPGAVLAAMVSVATALLSGGATANSSG